jgi:hypothetical protein
MGLSLSLNDYSRGGESCQGSDSCPGSGTNTARGITWLYPGKFRSVGRWSRRPPRLRLAPRHAQLCALRSASGAHRPSCHFVETGVLARAVVPVLVDRCVWRQFFKPHLEIVMQAAFVVVDKHTGRDVRQYSTLHAFTRGSALFVVYHSHASDGRGPGGNGPRPEQPQLNPSMLSLGHSHTTDGRGHWRNRPRPEQPQLNPTFATICGTSNALRMDPRSGNEPVGGQRPCRSAHRSSRS